MTYAAVPQMHRTRKRKAPPDDGAKDCHAWGYTRVTQSKPHPFTFAGQHVGIGAAAGRFLAITFSGMTRCHPRVVPSPGPPCASQPGGSGRLEQSKTSSGEVSGGVLTLGTRK